ncbi:MAG: protein kinase domain-containing protein [Ktedonobacteraceae bacterium]
MAGFVGQLFGNYRLERDLGKGAFAVVYLGRNIHLGKEVAIKILRDQLSTEDKEFFENEARVLLKLGHPNIVRLLDFGIRQDGVSYLIMDYAKNGSLDKKHPLGTRLSPAEVVAYVKQAAQALDYAHSKQVIHRDIKPANMLLGDTNEIILGDFGIAKITQTSELLTTGKPIGTLEFMAPEQIVGKPVKASDQYSLAIVVYLWLTGTLPFSGPYGELLMKQWKDAPPPLRDKVPALPETLQQVVLKALSKETNDRYPNVQAFAAALEQAIQPTRPAKPSVPSANPVVGVPVAKNPPRQPNRPPTQIHVQPPVNRPPVNRVTIPDAAQQWFSKGREYWHRKEYEKAIRAFDEAIRLAHDYLEAYNYRGTARHRLKQFSAAIQDFNRVIAVNPRYDWAYSNRGLAYLGLDKYELAIENYEQAIDLGLIDGRTYLYCGVAHELQGKHGPVSEKIKHFVYAIDNYDRALQIDHNDTQARFMRNRLYILLNKL